MNKKMLTAPLALAAALGLALTGCSSGGDATVAEDGTLKIDVPEVPMIEELGDYEDEVNILAWSGFVEPAWADQFTADTGCTVNRKIFATSETVANS